MKASPPDRFPDISAESLEKLFHEPNRLAIMSTVCAANDGITFGAIKDACGLTDGNLNRHLKVLREAGAVRIRKRFVGAKPQTRVFLTDHGLDAFNAYLCALENVLEKARQALPRDEPQREALLPRGYSVKA